MIPVFPSKFCRNFPVTGKTYDSMFRWYINVSNAPVLFRMGAFYVPCVWDNCVDNRGIPQGTGYF